MSAPLVKLPGSAPQGPAAPRPQRLAPSPGTIAGQPIPPQPPIAPPQGMNPMMGPDPNAGPPPLQLNRAAMLQQLGGL